MWIYGNGGHAKVVRSMMSPEFIIDDADPSLPWKNEYISHHGVVAIGDNRTRKHVVDRLLSIGAIFARYGFLRVEFPGLEVGEGTVIMHGAMVQPGTILGNHVIINTNASVDHDCRIGDFAHIAPGVTLCGNVEVGEGTLIGAGSVVIPGVKIGPWKVIRAGSVVTEDVA